MKILVISSTSDKERSKNIVDQFESQTTKFDYEIIEAVMYPSQAAVGTMRSFKKCIEIAKKGWWSEVLILEDDFHVLKSNSLESFIQNWNRHPLNDGLLLSGIYEGSVDSINGKVGKVIDKFSGLHGVILSEAVYDNILQAEEPYHLDYWISEVAKLPVYVCTPFLIMQQSFNSANNNDMKHLNEIIHLRYPEYV